MKRLLRRLFAWVLDLTPNPYHPLACIRGKPRIGRDTWIGPWTFIDGTGGLRIGDGCDISYGAIILSHTTQRRCVTGRIHDKIDFSSTIIGDQVFIGANATILPGCRIGTGATIGAGAVVPAFTVIHPGQTWAGVPASRLR